MSLRLEICKVGSEKDKKIIKVNRTVLSLETLRQIAINKVRAKKDCRLYLKDGIELTNEFLLASASSLPDGVVVLVSDSKGWKVPDNQQVVCTSTNNHLSDGSIPPFIDVLTRESIVENESVIQLRRTSELPSVKFAIGMPDIHPGRGFPIGVCVGSDEWIFPFLVGGDIGCGMSLVDSGFPLVQVSDKRLQRWSEKLAAATADQIQSSDPWDPRTILETELLWPMQVPAVCQECLSGGEDPPVTGASSYEVLEEGLGDGRKGGHKLNLREFDKSLGTIGGGNHFAELQAVAQVRDEVEFERMGLSRDNVYILAHSGSRGFGGAVLQRHIATFGTEGLRADSVEAREYMGYHDAACAWAKRNRQLICRRVCTILGLETTTVKCVLDIVHNSVSKKSCPKLPTRRIEVMRNSAGPEVCAEESDKRPLSLDGDPQIIPPPPPEGIPLWLHRKGAAPSDVGPVVIPGSRGHHSFLVKPTTDTDLLTSSGYSLAHGAGRCMSRGDAVTFLGEKYKKCVDELTLTPLQSYVVCENRELLLEEAPEAYKDVDAVIRDLEFFGLISVIAVMRPLVTYKVN